ncbi:MAG: glutamate--cysteine ligase, partial [Gammaproteobacteria bacterium]
AITAVLKALCEETWIDPGRSVELATEDLAAIFLDAVRYADETVIRRKDYLRLFGFPERQCQARELWQHLIEALPAPGQDFNWRPHLALVLERGCLARRIARAVRAGNRRSRIRETYRVLCDCLAEGTAFEGID